jgi:hypothetical protein
VPLKVGSRTFQQRVGNGIELKSENAVAGGIGPGVKCGHRENANDGDSDSHGHSPTTRVKQNRTRRIAWVRLQEPNVQDCGKDRLCKKCRILKFAELSALQKGIALSEDGDTFVQCHECSSGTLASLLPRRTRRTFFQVVGVMAKVENQNLQHFSRPGTACHSDRKPLAGRYERRAGSKGANNATVLSSAATNAKVAHRTTAVCVTT